MSLTLYCVVLTATALIAIPPASIAHGMSANHFSAVETHDNDRDHDRYATQAFTLFFHTVLMASAITMRTIAILPQRSR